MLDKNLALDKLNTILRGIDSTEADSSYGWWETSGEVMFGSEIKSKLISLVEELADQPKTVTAFESALFNHKHQLIAQTETSTITLDSDGFYGEVVFENLPKSGVVRYYGVRTVGADTWNLVKLYDDHYLSKWFTTFTLKIPKH